MRDVALPLLALILSTAPACSPRGFADEGGYGGDLPAMSGVAHYRDDLYLVVHDTKRPERDPRLSALALADRSGWRFRPLRPDWSPAGPLPHDLEAIGSVPGRDGEFLVTESGHEEDHPGRIFHLRVAGERLDEIDVRVMGKIDLPPDIHNVEGLAVTPPPAGGLPGLVLCERDERKVTDGGSDERFALVGWSRIDLADHRLLGPTHVTRVRASVWPSGKKVRTCSDLYYDVDGATLWLAAAAAAHGDDDADSIVYRVAPDAYSGDEARMTVGWRVPGLKVEGLARPITRGSGLTIVTDADEAGGKIRSLAPRVR